jgi:hypothetical protein
VPPQSEAADLPTAQDPSGDADDSTRDDEIVKRLTGDGCIRPKSKPQKKEVGTYVKPNGWTPVGFYWQPKRKQSPHKLQAQKRASLNEGRSVSKEKSTTRGDSQSEEATEEDTQPPGSITIGDIVFIEEHGWAGVKNASGIASVLVLESRFDDDGDLLYDVKYIIGGTARGVLAEYVSLHNLYFRY